jgi:hypothetical protein
LFAVEFHQPLCEATQDLSWLFTRGYAPTSALKIVGDRYCLNARQRLAVSRCACSDQSLLHRRRHQVPEAAVKQHQLVIDGFNVLTSVEAALSDGVILQARDGCYRDMASVHGTYRIVQETLPGLHLIGQALASCQVGDCRWFFDQPVSNSGRLKVMLSQLAAANSWNWTASVVTNPDDELLASGQVIATADSQILDGAKQWFNLARYVIHTSIPDAWIVDLSK